MCACGLPGEPGVPPDHRQIWLQALAQVLTAMVTDFAGMACDRKFHQIDLFSPWVQNMRRFLWYIAVIATITGSR